jgi:hypothetical protein
MRFASSASRPVPPRLRETGRKGEKEGKRRKQSLKAEGKAKRGKAKGGKKEEERKEGGETEEKKGRSKKKLRKRLKPGPSGPALAPDQ